MPAITIYSDYVCPFCFLAEEEVVKAQRMLGKEIEVEWMPFELRSEPTPTLRPEDNYLQTTWKNSVYPMAEELGVKIQLPSVSPQPYSHLAFEGFQFAKEHGKGNAYTHRMFTAFFQESQDIGDIEVLTQLAAEIGLDREAFREALISRRYKAVHEVALKHAFEEKKITAVPTMIIKGHTIRGMLRAQDLVKVLQSTE
ncbi:DsbA family oxidoreductase [Rufibacter hautae]|uniref:DsbA family oxidoreductase n=1 Tax=Rufibacter hautae TaxID=2595005 RepID=A0A5B6TMH1_9BACT|nr:DsbA family oxidoreductase [Rufibacter hautae]KAA3440700.1 DsbA family oxidoreductase [Rufibacter hautae]